VDPKIDFSARIKEVIVQDEEFIANTEAEHPMREKEDKVKIIEKPQQLSEVEALEDETKLDIDPTMNTSARIKELIEKEEMTKATEADQPLKEKE
ncbi:MAG: hypothetical protein ACK56I_00470, partial [bacterium]